MNKAYFVAYQGINIYYMDFSGLKTEQEITNVIQECKQHIRNQSTKSVIGLANIDNMHFNANIKEIFADFVKGNSPYMKASAVVGVTGLKQIVFNGLMKITGRDVKSFNHVDDAKRWLASLN
jgi:hypothetical protein